MTNYQQSGDPEFPTHDFYTERKWLFLLEGFGLTTGKIYLFYVALMYCFYIFFLFMAFYAMYLVTPNNELIISALHVVLNTTYAIAGLTIGRTTSVGRTREIIHNGFFRYENEEPDERIRELRKGTVAEVRKRANQLACVFMFGSVLLLVFFPICQCIWLSDEDYEAIVDISNPYLCQFMYLPFSTRSPIGFIVAFVMNAALVLHIYATVIVMNDAYLSCTVQLRIQLAILNHSIKTIQKRAYLMYRKNNNEGHKDFQESLFGDPEYQRCLYICLRSNIQHHQLLKKFHAAGLPYTGSFLFTIAMLGSFIFASQVYLVLKCCQVMCQARFLSVFLQSLAPFQHNLLYCHVFHFNVKCMQTVGPPLYMLITFVLTFLTEQTCAFFLCYFGETVLEESSNLFESLYSISWMNCNKSFNKALNIFMVYTRKPIRVKTIILDVTASLQTWGDFLSAMYKIMNLFRQSDR